MALKIICIYFRYGLPVNFQAILVQPYKKNHKRLRDLLFQLYGHLDGSSSGANPAGVDVKENHLK